MITKKEISEKVICTRGSGFSPNWKYYVEIDGMRFRKEFTEWFATTGDRQNDTIGEVHSKREFVDRVYIYLNQKPDVLTNEDIREMYESGAMDFETHRTISEAMEQMASEMDTNVENHTFLGDFWYYFDPSEYGFQ